MIGIDFTDEMLHKATSAAKENGFTNVEFRKGDIEDIIPVEENPVDVAISNCVINLATDKVKTFRDISDKVKTFRDISNLKERW